MSLRVLIVAEHASAQYGGEAALPLQYYRILRKRGISAWMVVHERTRAELSQLFPQDRNIIYVADTIWHRILWQLHRFLPQRLFYFTVGMVMRLLTQLKQRQIIRDLLQKERIDIIHQPIPVSPKEPSMIFGMGVPVVIGPMNGGMDYPPGFKEMQKPVVNLIIDVGRSLSNFVHHIIPGKRQAALLLVANHRTRQALPQSASKRVIELVENGVNLSLWQRSASAAPKPLSATMHYVFVGRLVDWKAVDLLLIAFQQAASIVPMSLTVIGDGAMKHELEQKAQELNLLAPEMYQSGKVFFTGWLPQKECSNLLQSFDALVLPSLLECGGAVVLEAMAKGLPVIATNWGGPADYIDRSCGILIDPSSRDALSKILPTQW